MFKLKEIHLIIVNSLYQNVPISLEVSTKSKLEAGLLSGICPCINVEMLARVVATDQRGVVSSLCCDSLFKSFFVDVNYILKRLYPTWKESVSHFPTLGSVATIK